MLEQLSFDGLPPRTGPPRTGPPRTGHPRPRRKPTDRLFLAFFPDADAARETAKCANQLRGDNGLSGRPIATERFHITLYHLGDFDALPRDIVAAAHEAAASVMAAPFKITLDRAGNFHRKGGNLPLVLRGGDGVAEAVAFQKILAGAMRNAGCRAGAELHFTPHMTLLYDDRNVPEQPVEKISWIAQEFVLVHSLLGQARHIRLGRWPLRG